MAKIIRHFISEKRRARAVQSCIFNEGAAIISQRIAIESMQHTGISTFIGVVAAA